VLNRRTWLLVLLPCLTVTLSAVAWQAGDKPADKPPDKAKDDESKKLRETLTETTHTATIGGETFEYKAAAGTLLLKEEDGKTTASVFYVAYTKSGVKDLAKRPLTFTFNGGPGSSSVWLHMGAFGPRKVVSGDAGALAPPPARVVDNELSLLDETDLVFIDPVTTGYSRPAPGESGKQFHGVEQDVQSVGEFIRLYTTRHGRWGSPKFLAGESYGTTRAAGLVGYMQDRHGMNFNGVVLISSVLNFQTLRFDEGNDLPYVLFLPSYTATAWHHKKLPAELQADRKKALAEAEQFAQGEYATALLKGDNLGADERSAVRKKLARLTGLTEEFVGRCNLRIEILRFTKELLRGERETVGRFDSRFRGADADAAGERPEFDPSYAAVQGAYTAALNQHLRGSLKYESDLPYEILTSRVQPWDYGNARNRYLNVSPTLRQALTRNRDLRVFVACGYYDLATPYFAADYTFAHLGLEPALAKHVTFAYYDAGHMMYVHPASHEKLKKDLSEFLKSALKR
jgi:carboxypeptidase C (cathepsin A)